MTTETSATTTQESGADTLDTQAAESGATQEVTENGADTQVAATAEGQVEGADTTSQEGDTTTEEENSDRGNHQLTLEERAAQIADKIVQERLAEAEARRRAEAGERPDFVPIDYTAYDDHVARLVVRERQLMDDLALDPEDPREVMRQLRAVQSERATLESAFAENERKREAWLHRQQEVHRQTEFSRVVQEDINRTVAAMAKSRNISAEMIDAGRRHANEALKADPQLQKRFDDIITHRASYHGFSGVDAAVEMLWDRTTEAMSKQAEAARQKKEHGKGQVVAGGEGAVSAEFSNVHTFSDLLKLPSPKINEFHRLHPKKYEEMKKRHFK